MMRDVPEHDRLGPDRKPVECLLHPKGCSESGHRIDVLERTNLILATVEADNRTLRADLTALRERMRWVPVGERLPPDYSDVLVSQFDAVAKTSHVMAAYCVQYDDQNCVWFAKGRSMVTPTHWQPLPAAPEVQNG